jgi:hypothetical protein
MTTRFVRACCRNHDLRLLDIPDHVREVVEFGVHEGVVMTLAIA